MHVDKFESAFMWLSGIMLAIFAGAIIISVVGFGIHVPGASGQIDPKDIDKDPGFSQPGLHQLRDGVYEAYFVVQAWQFTPTQIEVPVHSEVFFYLTSRDLIHGFKVFDTDINIMVIPGQISQVTHTFNTPGKYQFYCHEYCGSLHHTMTGVITVTGANQ
jgi:cytochrome c oxidase subunit II